MTSASLEGEESQSTEVTQEDLEVAKRLLHIASQHGGVCSRKRLNRDIQTNFQCDRLGARGKITRIDLIPIDLRIANFGASWKSAGKSFQIVHFGDPPRPGESELIEATAEADCAPESESDSDTGTNKGKIKKSNKAIEDAMCEDIKETLRNLYPESLKSHRRTKEKFPTCFNVGSKRGGNPFENIDVLAIHWKNERHYEIVAVEAKQYFTAEAVFQALSYARFADRVWVAVLLPKFSDDNHIKWFMDEKNLELFEYAVDMGLGILACRRTQGGGNGRYKVYIQSYPRLQAPRKTCRENFERIYQEQLEAAGIISPHEY